MIAVVVPTIREDRWKVFRDSWSELFDKHEVKLITVWDGDTPDVSIDGVHLADINHIMGDDADLIFNRNDGVRNLGFAYVAKYLPEVEYIITLDDDVLPVGDTIADHITALQKRVPVSFFSHASEYLRGFPYNIRDEAEVVLSHGVWLGVKDWDAPTQLVKGDVERKIDFYTGAIPKGVRYTMCGMNIAFKRKLLPHMYFAPMFDGLDRFADIWLGHESKKVIDENDWAVVTGHAKVYHSRASNVFKNLQKEALGLELNENYGEDDYFKQYKVLRQRWKDLLSQWDSQHTTS